MKKRAWSLFLCLTYISVLSGMLMIHIRQIAEESERYLATLEVLALMVFAVAIVLLYMRNRKGEEPGQNAEELFIAETTVKKHVTHIYEKCGVSGRKEWKDKK